MLRLASVGSRPSDKGGGGGGAGHPDPEIKEGGGQIIFFRLFWPPFGLKIKGVGPPLDPPLLATLMEIFMARTVFN